jgi:hypothetical protein
VAGRFAVAEHDQEVQRVKNACLLALLAALAVALVPRASAREQRGAHTGRAVRAEAVERLLIAGLRGQIAGRRAETWRWERIMHRHRVYRHGTLRIGSVAYGEWVLRVWHRRAVGARLRAQNPPHKRQWLCIQRHEARWTDPEGPYYGGLQMDREFQATYGAELLRRKGTAEHWTPLEQMWVAERAYRTRGFWPWPNTARTCGLL